MSTNTLRPAYLNHGRWVIDCTCNTGWIVRPETPLLLFDANNRALQQCFCGAQLAAQFPPDFDDINTLVESRATPNRNWRPGESVADLRIENAAHGVTS